ESGVIEADFFIDCTGFSSLLIEKTLDVSFVSFNDNLFNDRAIAIPTPIDNNQEIPTETVSGAMKYGWAWKIPLVNRYGNGYVYSSEFVTPEDAESELRASLGVDSDNMPARHLKMRVGRREVHWKNNCLAVGLSQGFIEPLEATALMLVQFTIEIFADNYSFADSIDIAQSVVNKKINKMFDGVRDYIVAHYHLNNRVDTAYWIANREHKNHSDSLIAILDAWDRGLDFEARLTELRETQVYMRPSWYCLLAGMGRFPTPEKLSKNIGNINDSIGIRKNCDTLAYSLFPSHREYLKEIYGFAWNNSPTH
ncbi:MAG: tryptophan 7-halogenase, partial [Chitinophagaceae bacterium]